MFMRQAAGSHMGSDNFVKALTVGALLAFVAGLLAHRVGYDRDRSFYAVVLTVIAALYPLFAVTSGGQKLVPEVMFFAVFSALAAIGSSIAFGLSRSGFSCTESSTSPDMPTYPHLALRNGGRHFVAPMTWSQLLA
jgi:hypothetical protein